MTADSEPGGAAAVIFDLDGVLIDSEQVWDDIRRGLVDERGGTWLPDSTRAMMGMSTPEWAGYLAGLGIGMTADEAAGEVLRRLGERYGEAPPLIDGAVGAARAIAARLPLAVASSSPRVIIERVLRAAGLADTFRTFVSSEEVGRGKPAPDVYLEAARRLGVEADRCVAVEDSTNGVRAAVAAGMPVIVVPNRHFPPSAESVALTAARVEHVRDLTPATIRAAYGRARIEVPGPMCQDRPASQAQGRGEGRPL
ncbi:HAD family phosphatase [Pseudofrankia sp. DC12]|uniref:HAD family hydrolase n=1 Tax=Pseudofrankia sp. DC12 TaxID=683315 RepID=UPI0005F801E2|nr:HAD family phosphatase [Pseudofrankia sp. DC12]